MLPPAPVISTVLPRSSSRDAGLVELHRLAAEQVLGLDVAHAVRRVRGLGAARRRSARSAPAGRWRRPARARARRCAGAAEGIAITRCVAAPRTGVSRTAASGPSTGTPAMRAPCLAGSSSSRPSTIQPCWWMPASSRLRGLAGAEHERAADLGVAAGDARARVLVEHAVGDAHHAHAHQRDHRVQRQHRARHLRQAQRHHHRRAGQRPPAAQASVRRLTSPKPEKRHMLCGTPEQRKGHQVGRHHAEHHPGVVARPRRDPALEAEAEQVGDVPAGGDHQRVDHQRQRLAVRAQPRQEAVEPVPDASVRSGGAMPGSCATASGATISSAQRAQQHAAGRERRLACAA